MRVAATAAAAVLGCLLVGCGAKGEVLYGDEPSPSPTAGGVPAEFLPACGHPGATVAVQAADVVIAHDACDLTGTILTGRGAGSGGCHVPPSGGCGSSTGVTVSTDAHTHDVTFHQDEQPGNA
jgi:hypothetical protein